MAVVTMKRSALAVLVALGAFLGGQAVSSQDPAPADVPAQLAALNVAAPVLSPAYVGETWGEFIDLDGDCKDTRDEALEDALVDEVLDAAGCNVVSGGFRDPYTGFSGEALTSGLQIDHRVSQADAHRSGGHAWSPSRRLAFTNDERNLVPTTSRSNICKSDKGPAEWSEPPSISGRVCDKYRAPTDVEDLCFYAEGYTATKATWGLSITPEDKAALAQMLQPC